MIWHNRTRLGLAQRLQRPRSIIRRRNNRSSGGDGRRGNRRRRRRRGFDRNNRRRRGHWRCRRHRRRWRNNGSRRSGLGSNCIWNYRAGLSLAQSFQCLRLIIGGCHGNRSRCLGSFFLFLRFLGRGGGLVGWSACLSLAQRLKGLVLVILRAGSGRLDQVSPKTQTCAAN